MKKIVVNIRHGLMREAVMRMLSGNGGFLPMASEAGDEVDMMEACLALQADILLLEVAYDSDMSVKKRLCEIRRVRERIPRCKVVLLCDEKASTETAHEVMCAKRDGYIDHFFYSSLSEAYMSAMLTAL